MGRNSSNHSESPVRRRGSPLRRSPSNRERSPGRHKSSHRGSSPVREKSPSRHRRSHRDHSLEREKRSSHTKSPKHASSRSPSPRTKRLRRPEAEKEVEKVEREYERNNSRGSEKSTHKDRASGKERISEREMGGDRKDRRSGRDDIDSKSSRGRQERSVSPSDRHHRSRHRSRSPASNSRSRDEVNNSRGAEHRDDEDDSVAKMKAAEEALEAKQKQKPTFELSGKLAAETNRVRGVTLLFNEPPDARKPDIRWRLYVFKAGEVLNEPLYIHRQSCYLFGRERRVADVPTDHPSCSKQHAVIQFRQVEKEQPDGTLTKQVRPYIMDLGSTNKTFINDNPVEPQRYYELFEKDTIKFGNSSHHTTFCCCYYCFHLPYVVALATALFFSEVYAEQSPHLGYYMDIPDTCKEDSITSPIHKVIFCYSLIPITFRQRAGLGQIQAKIESRARRAKRDCSKERMGHFVIREPLLTALSSRDVPSERIPISLLGPRPRQTERGRPKAGWWVLGSGESMFYCTRTLPSETRACTQSEGHRYNINQSHQLALEARIYLSTSLSQNTKTDVNVFSFSTFEIEEVPCRTR
ncbi:hypothetical protein GOBAR_AA21210 [Gossypium barbadense]|uniref:FHA domain-containing protein n=1 Tax=Gossypium barbadense TaxID=3634 RepID=A0A2P5X7Z0_GOSBA|nr:hypothetical protein GOBAR_AA21210 [Gossypium barbadense]